MEKQNQHAKGLAEKLWLAERQIEEMEVDKETRDKRTADLNSTILRLEEEVQERSQAAAPSPAGQLLIFWMFLARRGAADLHPELGRTEPAAQAA